MPWSLQAAVNACDAAGGGIVELPRKSDLGETPLRLHQNTGLIGETDAYVSSDRGTRIIYRGKGPAIIGRYLLNLRLENFTLDCKHAAGGGMDLRGLWRSSFRNLCVRGVPPSKGYGILVDTHGGVWGGQHNVFDNIECDGVIGLLGNHGADGVTTTELRTVRGLMYHIVHSHAILTNTTAEIGSYADDTRYAPGCCIAHGEVIFECLAPCIGIAPPHAMYWQATALHAGFTLDGSGTHATFNGADIEGAWPTGVAISNGAKVFGAESLNWNGFTGAVRVAGDVQPYTSHGGAFDYSAALEAGVEREIMRAGDSHSGNYVSMHVTPVNIGGGEQDGFFSLHRRIRGVEVVTHELVGELRFPHSKAGIGAAPVTVLTLPIAADTGVIADCSAYGSDGDGTVYSISHRAAITNDSSDIRDPPTYLALKNPVGYAGGFIFKPDGSNLLVQFATASQTPSTAHFQFDIRGPVAGYRKE